MWGIKDVAGGTGFWFSLKAGAELGSPGNGWTDDTTAALQFAREDDAKRFQAAYLRHVTHAKAVLLG